MGQRSLSFSVVWVFFSTVLPGLQETKCLSDGSCDFFRLKEGETEKMDKTANCRYEVSDKQRGETRKEVSFLRNKLTMVLLRRRLQGRHAKYFFLVSISDIPACTICLCLQADSS